MQQPSVWQTINTRQRWGWILYDWANSAFVLCVITVIGSAYFVGVFESAAEQAGGATLGPALALDFMGMRLTAEAAWSLMIGLSAAFVAFSSPLMGALADMGGLRKQFLATYCLLGVLATLTLWFPMPWWAIGLVIMLANIGFEGGNVFYNAFLPDIAKGKKQDIVSSAGYAFGYLGGVLVLIAALLLFVPPRGDVRNTFVLVGLWWGGFAVLSLMLLPRSGTGGTDSIPRLTLRALGELKRTFGNVARTKDLALFLVAFLLYNDGIATLISNATPYALQNIFLDDALTQPITLNELIPVIIMIQLIAFPGAFFCGWLATRFGEKQAIYFTLVVFAVVLSIAQVAQTLGQFYIMAAFIGMVLGGSQAISRSLFASLIPKGKNAEFFAFFAFSSKFSAVIGPLVYAGLLLWSGDTRLALLSLVVFFILGGIVLYFVDLERGRKDVDRKP